MTQRSSHTRRAIIIGGSIAGLFVKDTAMAQKTVSIAYADGTGSFLVLLAIAEQEALFQKYGVNVQSVGIKGATVPRLTADMPLGMIGEPDFCGRKRRTSYVEAFTAGSQGHHQGGRR